MIEFRIYKNGNKTKSQYVIGPDGYYACTNQEFFEIIRQYNDQDFWFNDKNNNKDVTYEKMTFIIKDQEMQKTANCDLLTRIIKNGGFINYIEKLENELNLCK